MLKLNQVRIRPGHSEAELRKKAADMLRISVQDIVGMRIIRQSVDARKKPEIFFSYALELDVKREDKVLKRSRSGDLPLINKSIAPRQSRERKSVGRNSCA